MQILLVEDDDLKAERIREFFSAKSPESYITLAHSLNSGVKAVLGSAFTGIVQVPSDQQVIQSGPYKLVRHPAYSGIILASIVGGITLLQAYVYPFTLMVPQP